MTPRRRAAATALAVLTVLAAAACGSDDDPSGASDASETPEDSATSEGPVAPDGTYASEVDAAGQQVTLTVADQAITRIEANLVLECGGATAEIDSQLEIAIGEDGSVDYLDDTSTDLATASTSLAGTFDDGTFDGTYAWDHPTELCGTAEVAFTADAS